MKRKHYIIGSSIIALAFFLQPFSLMFTQMYVAPAIYDWVVKATKKDDTELIKELGISETTFNACLENSIEIQAKIMKDASFGESLGVTGTPNTFLGVKNKDGNIVLYSDSVNGALPEQSVREMINKPNKTFTSNVVINDDLRIYGNPNAKQFLVEFADLQCPFCKQFNPTIKKIVDESNGEIALVYKHFPLSFHENAIPWAVAAECVREQAGNEGFFKFVDYTFEYMQ